MLDPEKVARRYRAKYRFDVLEIHGRFGHLRKVLQYYRPNRSIDFVCLDDDMAYYLKGTGKAQYRVAHLLLDLVWFTSICVATLCSLFGLG